MRECSARSFSVRFALIAAAILIPALIVFLPAIAFDVDGATQKRPLDLPSGGLGSDGDEEDRPEIIIFYGGQYESDAFFWCLDKSGSMSGSQIQTLQEQDAIDEEVQTAVRGLRQTLRWCASKLGD